MNVHLPCQFGRVLPPPNRLFKYSLKGSKIVSQDLVSTTLIKALLTEVETAQSYQFELGDDIVTHPPTHSGICSPSEADDLFLMISGRVRLLADNKILGKTVSVACLGPGEAFGGDRSDHSLPYRARAAAAGQLVRLPYAAAERGLSQRPSVLYRLQSQLRRRSQLAFFKQCTPLGVVPSLTLSQRLLPRLIEQPLQAGRTLVQYPLASGDYLWLRRGCLLNPAAPEGAPQVGEGWVYATAQGNWVAQTDGLLYQLPCRTPAWNDLQPLL